MDKSNWRLFEFDSIKRQVVSDIFEFEFGLVGEKNKYFDCNWDDWCDRIDNYRFESDELAAATTLFSKMKKKTTVQARDLPSAIVDNFCIYFRSSKKPENLFFAKCILYGSKIAHQVYFLHVCYVYCIIFQFTRVNSFFLFKFQVWSSVTKFP